MNQRPGSDAPAATPEVWLRGAIDGVPPLLQPVAHSLLQSRNEVERLLADLSTERIWQAPTGAASIGFHVLHAIGSLDRLFTYARGAMLSEAQLQILAQESLPDTDLTAEDLQVAFEAAVVRAIDQLRDTSEATLTAARSVGRARLPSTVAGLLFHAAEHTQRHVGQALTTSRLTQHAAAAGLNQRLGLVALVVRDYGEALDFLVGTLGFTVVEDRDVPAQGKRWVVVAPPGGGGANLLLARASAPEQEARVGNQTGGRVFLFLYTDDFWRDYNAYTSRGVVFIRPPAEEPYGTVSVFLDLYGNRWDLVQLRSTAP